MRYVVTVTRNRIFKLVSGNREMFYRLLHKSLLTILCILYKNISHFRK
ncbi:hypothetical protein VPHF86_0295 [Vibrio phage F86]